MIDYNKLTHAIEYYEKRGFKYIDAEWDVNIDIADITVPEGRTPYPLDNKVLVGSGEHFFMELMSKGGLKPGRYCCLTPCFRQESTIDDLHKRYFMKVELIDTEKTYHNNVLDIVNCAMSFFKEYLMFSKLEITTEKAELNNKGLIEKISYDINYDGIELGSYGLRSHPKIGEWVYGTGCAEPRLSYIENRSRNES